MMFVVQTELTGRRLAVSPDQTARLVDESPMEHVIQYPEGLLLPLDPAQELAQGVDLLRPSQSWWCRRLAGKVQPKRPHHK
jgi:hypothetical protein